LDEHTISSTQAKINRLLRMDYETFINSAFLMQGRADEFTSKTPAERKRILGEILGLDLYDRLEERAKEKVRLKEDEELKLKARIEEMEREIQRLPEYEKAVKQAEAQVAELGGRLRKAEEEWQALQDKLKELEFKERRLKDLEQQLGRDEEDLRKLDGQIESSRKRLEEYRAILAREEEIRQGLAALEEARRRNSEFQSRLMKLRPLEEKCSALKYAVAQARRELEWQLEKAGEEAKKLEEKASLIPKLEADLEKVREELASLEPLEEEAEEKRRRFQEAKETLAALKAQNEEAKNEMNRLKERIEILKKAEARCPLCGQELSPERRDEVVERLYAEGQELKRLFRERQDEMRELRAAAERWGKELRSLEARLREKERLQRQEATLEQSLGEAREALTRLEGLRASIAEVEKKLADKLYAQKEQEELARVEEKIRSLAYDEKAHKALQEEIQQLRRWEEEERKLRTAAENLSREEEMLRQQEETRRQKAEAIKARREEMEALARELERLSAVAEEAREKAVAVEVLQEEERKARERLAAARQQVDYARRLESEREELQKLLKKTLEDRAIYQELREAFGKKGIQAMIIESVLPELEEEANRLLERMTEGRMHVRFETQRITKKGTPVETLDIKIADELGTRSYELYSGGEAFRVDFAIRIALSKLLARRAGAHLSTLFIDEGFGTQDSQGRARLVEAINSIRDDFQLILVITHLDELKDAFPVRIDVFKTPQGSRVTVN